MPFDLDPVQLLIGCFAFLFSATCHEAGHALVARLGGDDTAYQGGQVTLDPLPHIRREPFGMILAPVLGMLFIGFPMGWASAPYDPYWANRHPRRYALMSLAGPAANLVLAVIFLLLFKILATQSFFIEGIIQAQNGNPSIWSPIADLIFMTYMINIILMLFNLIPLPPLDGAGGILYFVPERKIQSVRETLDGIGIMGLPLAWILFSGILNNTPLLAFFRDLFS